LGTDPGDGHPSSSASSSIDSVNLEGEVHPVEFDTALPVEHNVSTRGASGEGETCGQVVVLYRIFCTLHKPFTKSFKANYLWIIS